MISPDPRFERKREGGREGTSSSAPSASPLAISTAPPLQKSSPHAKRNRARREIPGEPAWRSRDGKAFFPRTGEDCRTFASRDAPLGTTTSARSTPSLRRDGGEVQEQKERSDGRAPGDAGSAICVQRLDDSLNSAIHTRYRSLLRSSSMHEPRGPPLEVVFFFDQRNQNSTHNKQTENGGTGARSGARGKAQEFPRLRPGSLFSGKERAAGNPDRRLSNPVLCTWVSAENQRL